MENQPVSLEALRLIKHDIKNQLSNIHLALDTIKYEVNDPNEDVKFCIESIAASAAKIDELVREMP